MNCVLSYDKGITAAKALKIAPDFRAIAQQGPAGAFGPKPTVMKSIMAESSTIRGLQLFNT